MPNTQRPIEPGTSKPDVKPSYLDLSSVVVCENRAELETAISWCNANGRSVHHSIKGRKDFPFCLSLSKRNAAGWTDSLDRNLNYLTFGDFLDEVNSKVPVKTNDLERTIQNMVEAQKIQNEVFYATVRSLEQCRNSSTAILKDNERLSAHSAELSEKLHREEKRASVWIAKISQLNEQVMKHDLQLDDRDVILDHIIKCEHKISHWKGSFYLLLAASIILLLISVLV